MPPLNTTATPDDTPSGDVVVTPRPPAAASAASAPERPPEPVLRPLRSFTPGRLLDQMVAELWMGWTPIGHGWYSVPDGAVSPRCTRAILNQPTGFTPSTDDAHALEIIERARTKQIRFELRFDGMEAKKPYTVFVDGALVAQSGAFGHAVCLAALWAADYNGERTAHDAARAAMPDTPAQTAQTARRPKRKKAAKAAKPKAMRARKARTAAATVQQDPSSLVPQEV